MPRVDRLTVYPVKALSPAARDRVTVADSGALAGDREWILLDGDGEVVNGKATPRVHELTTELDGTELTVVPRDGDAATFDLVDERAAAEAWFSSFFDRPVRVRRVDGGRPDRSGTVSVVSTATIQAVADWFEEVTVAGLRRRLRANVEVADVDPFWEDRFVGADAPDILVGGDTGEGDGVSSGDGPAGGVRLEGVEHCGRCVVPTRDPETGEETPAFRERFVRKRREHYPDWVDEERLPHDYTLMLIAEVPAADRGDSLAVGQRVRPV